VTTTLPVHEAGLYDDIPDDAYHRSHALSSSGARKLLPPSCPARYKWDRDNGQAPKAAWDFGKAAHAHLLGVGAPVVRVDADNWRSKKAQEAQQAAYDEGRTPVLEREWQQVIGMADAVRAHPIASALLEPDGGRPEVSAFWEDPQYDIWRRIRLDWLPDTDGGRLIVPDYKSCQSADPRSIAKSVASFGYHVQEAFYRDGLQALEVAEDVAFVFIFQEKTAPYLITVVQLDLEALRIGRVLTDRACQVFADCTATDTWPSYTDDIETVSLPGWATYLEPL
jgi:PDDEXK-like domain of unknown function (DUF3799)